MDTHYDAVDYPEGKKDFPHVHEWRIGPEREAPDSNGRPYCTGCGAKPGYYSIYKVDDQSFEFKYKTEQKRAIVVERDRAKRKKKIV